MRHVFEVDPDRLALMASARASASARAPAGLAQFGQPAQLDEAIASIVDRLPLLQSHHRRVLAAVQPADAESLVDGWYAFLRQLTLIRYRSARHEVGSPHAPDGHHESEAFGFAATLLDTYRQLCEDMASAEVRAVGPLADLVTRRERWLLMRRGDVHLRFMVRCALEHLDRNALGRVRTLVDMLADYLAADRSLSQIWRGSMIEPSEHDSDHVGELLTCLEHRRDAMEVLVIVMPGVPIAASTPVVVEATVDDGSVRVPPDDQSELLTHYPTLLAACRQMASRLASPARAVVASRVELLLAWSRYDDMLAGLRRQYVSTGIAPPGRVGVRDLHLEWGAAVRQRDEVLSCLAAAQEVLARAPSERST